MTWKTTGNSINGDKTDNITSIIRSLENTYRHCTFVFKSGLHNTDTAIQSRYEYYYQADHDTWIIFDCTNGESSAIFTACQMKALLINIPLTSRSSAGSYAFAVKGFCALFSAFKIRSGTQLHGCTDLPTLCRDKSHTYLPLPQIVCL